MLKRAAPLAAFVLGLPATGYADHDQGLSIGSTSGITLVVVCSQYPELNAAQVREFLEARTAEPISALIVDGFTAVPEAALRDEHRKKALLFAADRKPDQEVIDCVRTGMPLYQLVVDQSHEAWATIGLRQTDPAHPLYSENNKLAKYLAPTSLIARIEYAPKGNWTIATIASIAPLPQYIHSVLETWLGMSPTCVENLDCATD